MNALPAERVLERGAGLWLGVISLTERNLQSSLRSLDLNTLACLVLTSATSVHPDYVQRLESCSTQEQHSQDPSAPVFCMDSSALKELSIKVQLRHSKVREY